MAQSSSAQQQAQLQYLEAAAPKVKRVVALFEQMAANPSDDNSGRRMIRLLDELKAGASQLKISRLADVAGQMAMVARRGGGYHVKIRGLRDLLGALLLSLDAGVKQALPPEPEREDRGGQKPTGPEPPGPAGKTEGSV
jgi:hypothetical protein